MVDGFAIFTSMLDYSSYCTFLYYDRYSMHYYLFHACLFDVRDAARTHLIYHERNSRHHY